MRLSVIVATLWDCPAAVLNDANLLERVCREACCAGGFELLHFHIHQFQPQGLTAAAVLGESHLAIHTWPEKGAMLLDLATCAGEEATRRAFELVCARIPHGRLEKREIKADELLPKPESARTVS